ncbi:MAG: carboxypeptidase regulatory-like domain-containing protein, partial [Gemmatimonadaceae bacterium]|nr:carboxypeptidase regulatory-like domain-containing protein [Gemmatimonadaceae bacterium]
MSLSRPFARARRCARTAALLRLAPLVGALVAVAPVRALVAQTTEGYIGGVIRLPGGAPAADVTVQVRNESTGLTQARRTDAAGRFAFPQLPIGGPYAVTVRRIGYRPERITGITLNLGDRVPVRLTLTAAAQELGTVEVRESREEQRAGRFLASTVVGQKQLEELPILNRSFSDLALIAPTTSAVGTGGVITSSSSIAGSRVTSTDIRVDGVQAKNTVWGAGFGRGPYSLSVEAIREFEVVTNVYDVTQGRQGGGAINVATNFGTNRRTGSVFAYHRNRDLTTRDFEGRAPVDFRNTQWGGSFSGPIVRDRAHFFVAFDRQDVSEPFLAMDVPNAAQEAQLQVSRDSITRFLDILRRNYGLPQGTQVGQFTRGNALNSVFSRIDWTLNDRHRLTTRYTFSNFFYDNSITDRFLSVRESFGNQRSREHQLLVSLKSSLGATVSNDFRLAYTDRRVDNEANTRLPRGWVTVQSRLPNGNVGAPQILQFGGQRTSPEWQTERSLQLVNVTRVERGNTDFTFGTDNSLNRLAMFVSIETDGLFRFNNLADLEARRPANFTRLVPTQTLEPDVGQWVLDAGAFAQAETRVTPTITFTGGFRFDATSFLTRPNRNPLVEERLGRRTDTRAADFALQPRAQLAWDVGGEGRTFVRMGGGLFMAQPHYMAHINHLLNDGSQLAEVQLVGAAAPTPDFARYRESFANVPGLELLQPGQTRPAFINMMAGDLQMPRTWKGDIAVQRRLFGDRLLLGAAYQWSNTTQNYRYIDRNLRDAQFTLSNEGNRPVFVPASSINPATGAVNAVNGRATQDLGRVLELVSDANLRQRAAIVDATLRLPRGAEIGGSFTWNRTRDDNSYNCCIAITSVFTQVAADPRVPTWGFANNDFRHKVVVYGSLPTLAGFRLSGRYIGQSGSPVSFTVFNDMNGDDVGGGSAFANQNDLAFLFDPRDPTTQPEVAQAMQRVLDNPQNIARDFLRENLGRVAPRNGFRNPFFGQLDLR